jgi:hypothetical protein
MCVRLPVRVRACEGVHVCVCSCGCVCVRAHARTRAFQMFVQARHDFDMTTIRSRHHTCRYLANSQLQYALARTDYLFSL